MPDTYSFQLFFDDENEFDFPAPKKACIALDPATHTVNSDGVPILTPRCVSGDMLEKEVNRLKNELDELLAEAKDKFLGQA